MLGQAAAQRPRGHIYERRIGRSQTDMQHHVESIDGTDAAIHAILVMASGMFAQAARWQAETAKESAEKAEDQQLTDEPPKVDDIEWSIVDRPAQHQAHKKAIDDFVRAVPPVAAGQVVYDNLSDHIKTRFTEDLKNIFRNNEHIKNKLNNNDHDDLHTALYTELIKDDGSWATIYNITEHDVQDWITKNHIQKKKK